MSLQLKETLSQKWHSIQRNLFPFISEVLGPLSKKHQQLVTTLEMIRIEDFIQTYRGCVGRPPSSRVAIASAFVAKAVLNCPTTRGLLDRLKVDQVLRRICGWERIQDIPKEWVLSRAFAEFANSELCQKMHEALIKNYHSERIVGHISRDSTAIEAREKVARVYPPKVKSKKLKQKRGRPCKGEVRESKVAPELTRIERQRKMSSTQEMLAELPKVCDIGTKKNTEGHHYRWKGYKLHIDTADGGIPISAVLTSASVHDSQVAIPLATMTEQRVDYCYELMDAAYDAGPIRLHSYARGHVPLIDFNRRSKKDTRAFMAHEAKRYKERSTAERCNSRLKDDFGALYLRVKGHAKVMTHLMFGILALTVDQLIRFIS
jgi:Transposase DDE domain